MEDQVDIANTFSTSAKQPDEVEIVTSVLGLLAKLDRPARERILQAVSAFYGLSQEPSSTVAARRSSSYSAEVPNDNLFSEDRSLSPKQFMSEKQPTTDVEKVACLAYYLTNYRNMPHFKTLDISLLNTEAAQTKFSNPAFAVENAAKMNYLVPAVKGTKQISAVGEQFVLALPDRDRAKAIMLSGRRRRKTRRADGRRVED